MDPTIKIDHFAYEWRFLSNFYPVEVRLWITEDGMIYARKMPDAAVEVYASTEHAYQAAKTFITQKREVFQLASNPRLTAGQAKRIGRKLREQGQRSDWEQVNVGLMRELLQQKFDQETLKQKLLSTGTAYLEEGNTWHDTFWGVCHGKLEGIVCKQGEHAHIGDNLLGLLLMEVRVALAPPGPKIKAKII